LHPLRGNGGEYKLFEKFFMLLSRLLMAVFCGLLAACSVGADYVRPAVAVPARYKEANKDWRLAQPSDAANRGAWWVIFNNAELNALLTRVNISNQNIAKAEAQYRQAIALVGEARSGFFPSITGSANSTRQQAATMTSNSTTGPTNDYTMLANASWEIDLWGKVRRQLEANKANAEASNAALAAVRLSTQALLAQNYFQLRALDANQQILNNTVLAYQKSLQLTQQRYKSGIVTLTDTAQAQTQLKAAQAQALDNGIKRAQLEHAIAVLIGLPPANFSLAPKVFALRPPLIPLKMPSVLLERRPDIAEAERQMAAANAQIGVEKAAYFPTFTLAGAAGYATNNFNYWVAQPALIWSVGPQLAATIFDGGLRKAKIAAAGASYDQNVANYRQVILAAFQEVEDNLAALRILNQESKMQQQAVASAQLAVKLALNNYKAGTVAYTDVISAQTALYTAEKTAVDIMSRRMTAAVGLIAAMGGGF
jgi:NodT family efflux transporter outer membrane factor (OMF) lipoprotein